MSTTRVAFLGTTDFSLHSLQTLCRDVHFHVVGVVSQPDRPAGRKMILQASPVKEYCLQKGLNVFTPENVNTAESLATIKSWGAEAAVVVAYGQILSQSLLDLFNGKIVNLHASLLPRWRGAAPIQRAIMAGDLETGVALQKVTKKLDAGDVLGVRKLSLTDDLNALDVLEKMKELGADLLRVDFVDFLKGNLIGSAQDETQITYAKKIDKSEAEIHWAQPAPTILNHIRGMMMGPGSWTILQGKKLKIIKARVKNLTGAGKPGMIQEVNKNSFVVACDPGSLEVIEVQPESRAKMTVESFLKGYNLNKGDVFG